MLNYMGVGAIYRRKTGCDHRTIFLATHYSEETAAVEKSGKDVKTVTWKPHSQVNVTRTAETTRIRYRSDALSLFLLVGLSLRLANFLVPRRSLRSFIIFLCLLT